MRPLPLQRVLLFSMLVASAAAQTLPSGPPPAGTRAGEDQPVQLEAFTVTGSNIRRVDAETALPVTVIDYSELELRGAATMAELFDTITIAEPSGITEINSDQQGARGDVSSIDLRGLGSGSTLVLINGRRMAPHPISMAENGVPSLAPNINTVPRALIDRVEILRDGASAIYGADAAAGVINNLVSRTRQGRMLTLRGSMTQHGGAGEFGAVVSDAYRQGKTHIAVSLDYFHRDALSATQRDWANQRDLRLGRKLPAPWNGIPVIDPVTGTAFSRDNDFANTNNVNQYAQWQRGFIQSDFLRFNGARPTGNVGITTSTAPAPGVATMAADGTFFLWPAADGTVNFKQTAPSKNIDNPENAAYSNWSRWRILVPKTDRYQFATFIDRPLTKKVSLFGDLMVYHAHSWTSREPVNWDDVDEPGIYVPANNPWNPFGTRFYHPQGLPNADGTPRLVGTPADVTMTGGVTPVEMHPREVEVKSNAYRVLAGLRGKLAENWQWETGAMFSGAQTHEWEHFYVRESFLREALNRTDATALNPFGVTFKIVNNQIVSDQLFQNPAAVIAPLYWDDERYGRTRLLLGDAKVSGQLGRLPFQGGEVGVASGVEYRYETFDDKRPVYSGMNPPGAGAQYPLLRDNDNDIIGLSPNVGISAAQTIFAGYAELALPFVGRDNRLPLVHAAELTLAGRFEHFSIFGQTTKPKASLVWKPFPTLKLRGSFNESFRAPNLVQTNITPLRRNVAANDAYRSEVTGNVNDGSVNRRVFRQGSQNLKPESSESWIAGFVLEVPKVRGLSVTLDYWRINQNKVIENVGAPGTLLRDELALDLATKAALAAGTPLAQIDLGSGSANYQGYSKVTRAPVTDADRAAFATYNARNPNNPRAPVGEFVSMIDDYVNLGGRDMEGYELGLQYRLPATRIGTFTVSGDATHYIRREDTNEDGGAPLDTLERNGRAKWRATASLAWRQGGWSAGWFTSYYGTFVDTSAATTEAIYVALGRPNYIRVFNDNGITRYLLRVDPVILHNASVSYRFGKESNRWVRQVSVRASVNNVFDLEPPVVDETNGFQGGTINPRGRQFALEVSKRF
jgi:iron complex outermembrane recepter protein